MSLHEEAAVASLPSTASRQGLQVRRRTRGRGSSRDAAGKAREAHGYPASL